MNALRSCRRTLAAVNGFNLSVARVGDTEWGTMVPTKGRLKHGALRPLYDKINCNGKRSPGSRSASFVNTIPVANTVDPTPPKRPGVLARIGSFFRRAFGGTGK
jgi:hypothetical protein